MDPLVVVVIVLTLLLLAAAAGAGYLAFDRSKLMSQLATLAASHEEVKRIAEERDEAADAARRRADAAATQMDGLQVEAATLRERFASREREFKQTIASTERRFQERAERDEARLKEITGQLHAAFDALASKALDQSADRFLKLAKQTFEQQQAASGVELDKRQRAFRDLIIPVSESLKKTDEKLAALDRHRTEGQAALDQQLRTLTEQTRGLGEETGRLVRSLKAPHVRGRWGEMTLQRIVELAGMVEHCDFTPQETVKDDDGAMHRPDMLIRLPGARTIVLDAKAPLHAYLESMEAQTEEDRSAKLRLHARQVRQKIDALASKQYQAQFEEAPDFTVLFIPGDQFLGAALREEPDLLEHAASGQVILTTPATLIALLKAVQYGWAQASLAEDAREILRLGRDMHDRVGKMAEHLGRLGDRLRGSVDAYNRAVGSFESRVLPKARQMEEHNIRSSKKIDELQPVTVAPRLPAPAPTDDADVPGQQQLDIVTREAEPSPPDREPAAGAPAKPHQRKAKRKTS